MVHKRPEPEGCGLSTVDWENFTVKILSQSKPTMEIYTR